MDEDRTASVGLDAHEATIAVAVAEQGRLGEVHVRGEIANRSDTVRRLVERLGAKHGTLRACHEADTCGYGLHRQIAVRGHECTVVAPSLVPVRAGNPVKTDRRDAVPATECLHPRGEILAPQQLEHGVLLASRRHPTPAH